jgi:hypothetical protein
MVRWAMWSLDLTGYLHDETTGVGEKRDKKIVLECGSWRTWSGSETYPNVVWASMAGEEVSRIRAWARVLAATQLSL